MGIQKPKILVWPNSSDLKWAMKPRAKLHGSYFFYSKFKLHETRVWRRKKQLMKKWTWRQQDEDVMVQYKREGAERKTILNNQPQMHIEHSLIISIFRSTLMNRFLTLNSSFLYHLPKSIPYFLSISLFCIFSCNFHSLVIIYIGDSSL